MDVTENAKRYREKMFPESESSLQNTDPEFVERLDNFALDEVVNSDDLDDKTRFTAILASLLGCGGIDAYKTLLPAAMNFGVTATEVKEIVYQATAYLGIGRTYPFLMATNEALRCLCRRRRKRRRKTGANTANRRRSIFSANICADLPNRAKRTCGISING